MPPAKPMLHMMCGKIAAGKSTLALRLAQRDRAVLIAEDVWLSALFRDEMSTPRDYVRCAERLRRAMGPHVTDLLRCGVSVVLDFPANTVETRAWMREILDGAGAAHELHVLTAGDDLCLARMHARTAKGEHPFAVTEEQFHAVSKHFVAPSPDEGFNLVIHEADK